MKRAVFFDWEAVFAPEYGGNLCCLAWRGHDILRPPPTPEALDANRVLYGFPVLFPAGRIRDGRFSYRGNSFSLPVNEPARGTHVHGVANGRPWRMEEPGGDVRRMIFDYGADAPEFAGFPCSFRLALDYRFRPDAVEQLLTVTNTGDAVFPCCPGFHTEFCAPARVRIAEAGCWEIEDARKLATGKKIPWTDFRPDRWFVPDDRMHSLQFAAPETAPAAEIEWDFGALFYTVDPKFRDWCVWNPEAGCGFIALEPYAAVGGALNLPDPERFGVLPLAPGESAVYRSEFRMIPRPGVRA